MAKFENLYGGLKVEVCDGSFEEWAISMPMFKYFWNATECGKFATTKKALADCGLEVFNAQLERTWADICNYKKACSENNTPVRGEACKSVYKSIGHTLSACGVLEGYVPSTILTTGQWHLFVDAVAYRSGKNVGDACKVTSCAVFKKAVIAMLFNHASGRETLESVDDAKKARIESNLKKALEKRAEVLPMA